MKRFLTFLATLVLVAAPWIAIGQGFITSHSIPIGQGAGVQGWGIGGPCSAGQALVWPNATADPTCTAVGGGTITLSANDVFVGNSLNVATGVPLAGDCTIVTSGQITCSTFQGSSPLSTALPSADLFVGSAGNLATAQALSQDCTISNTGAITCTKTNNVAFGPLATQITSLVNSQLLNSSTTVNSQTCTLGSSCTVPTNIASATTGSGNVVLQTSAYIVGATIASPTIVSAFSAVGLVTNSDLTSSAIVVNATNCVLGSSCTLPLQSDVTSLKVGSTTITNGTSGRVVYNNNGIIGEYTTTGSPVNVIVLQLSPYIATPNIASPTIVSGFTATGLISPANLTSTAVNAGVYTNTNLTVNAQGLITSASNGTGGSGSTTGPTQTKFTSGSSTYTVPVNVAWIEVTMVGAGGGGGGVGATTGPTGTNGTSSTFGTSLLVAGPGLGGTGDTGASAAEKLGGAGGTASLGSGPLGIATTGNAGGPGINGAALVTTTDDLAGFGAGSCLGGSVGGSSNTNSNGTSASANSGAGGSGAGSTAQGAAAAGGGSGGCIYAFIVTPAATYSTVVGAGGNGGVGTGTNLQTGGAGGSGLISVIEHYNH